MLIVLIDYLNQTTPDPTKRHSFYKYKLDYSDMYTNEFMGLIMVP